jgi:integrase
MFATALSKRHAHVSAALRATVKSPHLPLNHNPAETAKPEHGERKKINPLSEEEAQRLFAATRDDPELPTWVILISTGCRASECRALRWQEISFERRTVSICSSIHREPGKGWANGPTKTWKNRVISLRPMAVNALKAHKTRQTEARLTA